MIERKSYLIQRATNLLRTHGAIPASLAEQMEVVADKIFQAQLDLQKDLNEING
jgi:hypothetical protein